MKTFILTVSKTFLLSHPNAGTKTFFKSKILEKSKIHTIRGNYKYWNKIVKKVNNGEAILSLREWTGKPYKSKQKIIKQYKKLGIQKITTIPKKLKIDNKTVKYDKLIQIAENDGLSIINFCNWFPTGIKNAAIIHFTDFRY